MMKVEVFKKLRDRELYDESGSLQKAKRQRTLDETIDTSTGYTVHPAFTDESSIGFQNGGWDSELTGIWVAKFEAGYCDAVDEEGNLKKVASSVNYTQSNAWVPEIETESKDMARNWLDGIYGSKKIEIKYPIFQGIKYSMNYINHNDSYNISKVLTENGNIYGFNSKNTDSHLMKNSEWGAVAYLAQSGSGLNGQNIYINNVNLNNSTKYVYAITGMCAKLENEGEIVTTIDDIKDRKLTEAYMWMQKNGTKASTTGNIYGIYDLSGGLHERTSAFVANGNNSLTFYGKEMLNNGLTDSSSTKYVTVYTSDDYGETVKEVASQKNYEVNKKIYGDAIRETSSAGTGSTSWYNDFSYFMGYSNVFALRGGSFSGKTVAGLFYFGRNNGSSSYNTGFRSVLVSKTEKNTNTTSIKINTKYENNTELTDAYGNKIVVPAGFKILSDSTTNATTVDKGIVIEDATGGATNGSQFVWIPVGDIKKADGTTEKIELNRYTFNDTDAKAISQGDKNIYSNFNELKVKEENKVSSKDIDKFKSSVIKNEGYYIGRYEARKSSETGLNNVLENKSYQLYNNVTQLQASDLSSNMYKSDNFISDLINSYAWDTAIYFLQVFGNNKKYSMQASLNTGVIALKGTDNDVQCNVYDMASNIREWTTENYLEKNLLGTIRGGAYGDSSLNSSKRASISNSYSSNGIGFRPILYINN